MLKTPTEIAEEYGFSVSYIRKLLKQGKIPSEKIGKCYAIRTESLEIPRKRQSNLVKKDNTHGSNQ